jgi:plasmid stabilization system protein ParE
MKKGDGAVMDDRELSAFLDERMVRTRGYFNDGSPSPFQTFDPESKHPGQIVGVRFSSRAREDLSKILSYQRSCGPDAAARYCSVLRDVRNRLGVEPPSLAERDHPNPRLCEVESSWLVYGVTDGVVQVVRVLHLWSYWENDLFGGVHSGDDL